MLIRNGPMHLGRVTLRVLHFDECYSVDLSELDARVCVRVCVSLKSDNQSY